MIVAHSRALVALLSSASSRWEKKYIAPGEMFNKVFRTRVSSATTRGTNHYTTEADLAFVRTPTEGASCFNKGLR